MHDTTITAPKLTVSIFPNLKQQQMHKFCHKWVDVRGLVTVTSNLSNYE